MRNKIQKIALIVGIFAIGLSGGVAFAVEGPPSIEFVSPEEETAAPPPSLEISIPEEAPPALEISIPRPIPRPSADQQAAATVAVQNGAVTRTADTGPGILIYSLLSIGGYIASRKKFKKTK